MKKYELIDENVMYNGHKLYRIKSLKRFETINDDTIFPGELGGFIESESNLSHLGNCWVADNAIVCGGALIKDNALILANAKVKDNALILDNSIVTDNAIVSGTASVRNDAVITGDSILNDNCIVQDKAIIFNKAKIYQNTIIKDFASVGCELFPNTIIGDTSYIKNISDYAVFGIDGIFITITNNENNNIVIAYDGIIYNESQFVTFSLKNKPKLINIYEDIKSIFSKSNKF